MYDDKNKAAIEAELSALNCSSASIEASAVMTRDGFPVVTLLSTDVDAHRLSAISASMLSLAEKAAADLHRGSLEQVLIHAQNGHIVLVRVDANTVLSVVSRFESKLGMLLVEAKKAAQIIAGILHSAGAA